VTVDELRRRESEAAQAESDWRVQRERSVAEWSARIRSERDNARDLRSQLADLDLQRSLFVLLSPVDGTAEQVISMSPGGFVQSGDELLQISPETQIAAEMQVSARDIGMLSLGMPVRMMIDTFDYNSWGVATGRIVSIGRDATMIERQAIFSVRCSIDQSELLLKNGYRGRIQKGMTLHARFLIARRSLFDLLYDRVDAWLNPSRASGMLDQGVSRQSTRVAGG
jgi:HlyD family secretion protein